MLFALSTTRTEEITRKFFQYRIVEFFTREIDLEFEVTQIRDRFLRICSETHKSTMEKPLNFQGEAGGEPIFPKQEESQKLATAPHGRNLSRDQFNISQTATNSLIEQKNHFDTS